MALSNIIAEIDAQIAKLQQARSLLIGSQEDSNRSRSKVSKDIKAAGPTKRAKRRLTPEGRKRIADAMKKRWADRRKQLAKG